MLNKKIVATKLYEFSMNYTIDLKPKYVEFIYKELNEREITDNDFCTAIKNFMENEETIFNKMPNLAQLLKYANKQPMTTEDSAKIKALKVYTWLENNVFITPNFSFNPPKKYIDWTYIRKNYKFEDSSINYVINDKYGSLTALIERFGEQKIAGYGGAFKKELEDVFRLQGTYEPDKFKAIGDTSETVKIDNVVKNLGNKLKGGK
jgi:hypothetical protein